ncbi:MAG: FAD-dependent thymidylate synthase [Parachlamydiaceae bacterium]|nr:FAD-dependent thymidylate synthase [Parachlamydiaceae bacterium]
MSVEDYEEFTESQLKVLDKYVTHTKSNIFALRNLPEVIKGALFSRYSRSNLGLRSLLLKEFVSNSDESAFSSIVGTDEKNEPIAQQAAIKKAQNFYDRILDGYGDDSIGELGGAHLAIENVSMLAAKAIEDNRIGGSPLEKSTRYIYFDQKVKGDYLFYREPILMTSAYRDIYINTCNMLFETYSRLIPPLTAMIEEKMPRDPNNSQAAYTAALRAKVLDCLRGLLPAGTLTNMGVYGNGRFFDYLINKLHCHNLAEMQDIGKKTYEELSKVIPSFVRRSQLSHRTHQSFSGFHDSMQTELQMVAAQHAARDQQFVEPSNSERGVRLIDFDSHAVTNVCAALLYTHGNRSLADLQKYCAQLSEEETSRILDAACSMRENRRHKSPRALEHAEFTFEIVADFGVYRDLHRHRTLTQERQLLTCDYGFHVPPEIIGTALENDYLAAMTRAKEVYDEIASSLPEEAQYVVPMAYNVRWYFHVNLRAIQWLCELRSAAAGHPAYRFVAQAMAKQVIQAVPAFERFLKFVDYEGYDLGRLDQEQRKVDKQLKV